MKCPQCGGTTFTLTPSAIAGTGAAGRLVCTDCRCPLNGRTVQSGTSDPILVGEAGPEVFVPRGYINPAEDDGTA